ncbi:MAG: hypothetical protein K9M95_11205 [Candidatus Cloacimonetes bacterium]|nr:hypothetical protein [Candidatus Cloacimonadota bacterium]
MIKAYSFNEDVLDAEEILSPQTEYNLSNYPNPFNPTTEIRFQISDFRQIDKIEISIYNLKGQKMKTLPVILSDAQHCIEGSGTPNSNSVVWKGDDDNNKSVSSGIYLYSLIINGYPQVSKKCVLLK